MTLAEQTASLEAASRFVNQGIHCISKSLDQPQLILITYSTLNTVLYMYVYIYIYIYIYMVIGPCSSVCIATELRAGRSGDRIPMGRDFPPVQTGPGAHPAFCTMDTGSFPGVKYGRGVLLTTHPPLMPWSWKNRAVPLPTLWATPRPVAGLLYLYIAGDVTNCYSSGVFLLLEEVCQSFKGLFWDSEFCHEESDFVYAMVHKYL